MGYVVTVPEIKYTGSGKAVGNFRIAVKYRYKKPDKIEEEENFFDVIVFGRLAESCKEFLQKGSNILLEGRIREKIIGTDEHGFKRTKIEIIAHTIKFITGVKELQGEETNIFEDTEY